MGNMHFLLTFLVCSSVHIPHPHGGIHEGDSGFGPSTVTVSPQQELEFLDLPLFQGQTFNQISDRILNGDLQDWRYASVDEVTSLFNLYGFWPPIVVDDFLVLHIDHSTMPLDGLVSSLGATYNNEPLHIIRAFTGDIDPSSNNPYRVFLVDADPSFDYDDDWDGSYTNNGVVEDFAENYPNLGPDTVSLQSGHWLVRPASSLSVPEPDSSKVWIFLILWITLFVVLFLVGCQKINKGRKP